MNIFYKKTMLLSIVAISCFISENVFSAQPQLVTSFKIIPNSNRVPSSNTSYEAFITVTNTGAKVIGGWQLDFDFSSADQTIKESDEKATQSGQHICIKNDPQHIRIPASGSRTVHMKINKNANTIPGIPTIVAKLLNN